MIRIQTFLTKIKSILLKLCVFRIKSSHIISLHSSFILNLRCKGVKINILEQHWKISKSEYFCSFWIYNSICFSKILSYLFFELITFFFGFTCKMNFYFLSNWIKKSTTKLKIILIAFLGWRSQYSLFKILKLVHSFSLAIYLQNSHS